MSKKLLLIIIILLIFISLLGLKIFTITPQGWKGSLFNPMGQKSQIFPATSTPIPTPTAPKSFDFDSSTDLKAELEKINPEVLEGELDE